MTSLSSPTFWDFFKSSYYSPTYLDPVDLSDSGISRYLLESEDPQTAAKAQQLISHPEVQSILSEPLDYDPVNKDPAKIEKKNEILMDLGFRLLNDTQLYGEHANKMPVYNVIEHEKLAGWVIKSGTSFIAKQHAMRRHGSEDESILQIEMANRIAKVAREAGIDLASSKNKLVAYANLDGVTEVPKKYCVICEKINVLSAEETIKAIIRMSPEQKQKIAQNISTIVQKAGFADASFRNIRLTLDRRLAFIGPKPLGLIIAKKSSSQNHSFRTKHNNVENCARLGLSNLMQHTMVPALNTPDGLCVRPGLEEFHQQIEKDYKKTLSPKFSKWKIALSIISVGLIPLINAIVALVKTRSIKPITEKLNKLTRDLDEASEKYLINKVPESNEPEIAIIFAGRAREIESKLQIATQQLQKEKFFEDHIREHLSLKKQYENYTRDFILLP